MKHIGMAFLGILVTVGVFALGLYSPYNIDVETEHSTYGSPDVLVSCYDPSCIDAANSWKIETARRFHNSVLVCCHGGYATLEGGWVGAVNLASDKPMESIAEVVKQNTKLYPGRTIVLLCCNTWSEELHGFPGVYYARSCVWMYPDRATQSSDPNLMMLKFKEGGFAFAMPKIDQPSRWELYPDYVGNIYEFVEAR